MPYRKLTRQEKTQVNRAFDRWAVYEALVNKTALMYDSGDFKMVYLMTSELDSITVKLQPRLAGLAIGRLKKQFVPTMAGADLFARQGQKNKFYVTVNENAEKLILYGRDVMGESIIYASEELNENELVILLNQRQEAVGIGKTRFSGKRVLHTGKVTITTLADAGSYLRDEF